MNIDESSITGNAEVMESIFTELGQDMKSPNFGETVKLIFGDQLSIARLRSLINNRAGHDSSTHSYAFAAFGPGFFHHQMAATHGIIETHWGDPGVGARNPGCLSFHNIILDRKPIIMSSLPSYRTCRDLIFVSLYARVLHFEELQNHAAQIVDQFANPAIVFKLRNARLRESLEHQHVIGQDASKESSATLFAEGDMVFENAVLFMRDALILREFMDAIKNGDSGRMVTILKTFCF